MSIDITKKTDSKRGSREFYPCASVNSLTDVNSLLEIGQVLRQAREAGGIELKEVSAQLNIFERHLRSLEAGELPRVALTFARGYLKNYAGYLKLDTTFLLASFDEYTRPQSEVEPEKSTVPSNQLDRSLSGWMEATAKWFGQINVFPKVLGSRSSWAKGGYRSPLNLLNAVTSAALPLLLLCIVAFAYYSVDAERPETDIVAVNSLQAATTQPEKLGPLASEAIAASKPGTRQIAANVVPDIVPEVVPDVVPDLVASNTNTKVESSLTSSIASSTNTSSTTETFAASDRPSVINNEAPALPAAYPIELVNQARRPEQVAAVDTTSQVRAAGVITVGQTDRSPNTIRSIQPGESIEDSYEPIGPGAVEMISQLQESDRLVITVYEDSWIDVRDNSGARLYRNLARAGRRIDVSGQLPFALHVGNVPGLEMRLNGEPVEITRYRSDNSARLILASNE